MVRTHSHRGGTCAATAVVADRRFSRFAAGFLALLVALWALAGQASATEPYYPWTWGLNSEGQLGDSSTTGSNSPIKLNVANIKDLAAGDSHSLAVDGIGWVWAWGSGSLGQLGNGTWDNSLTPVFLFGINGAVSVSAQSLSSMALKSDGTVWTWGDNWSGQLGNNTYDASNVPVQVLGPGGSGFLTDIIAIACGADHKVALKSDGTVWTWGNGWYGQLGDGTWGVSLTPVQVSGLTNVTAIAAGYYHTLALKSDGTVWAWGLNGSGQLGDGTGTDHNTAVLVNGLTSVASIGAGAAHSLAVKSDGTPWAWGSNSSGQLGDGTLNDSLVPIAMAGLSGVEALDGGYEHTLIKMVNREVYACGRNAEGQLGDGTNTDRLTAVRAGVLKKDISVVGGGWHSLALVEDPIRYTLDLTSDQPSLGSVSKTPDQTIYDEDDLVVIEAQATPGNYFSGWDGLPGAIVSGTTTGTGSIIQFNINENLNIVGHFEPPMAWLQYSATAGGTILCPYAVQRYEVDTISVNMFARPDAGYGFLTWIVNGQEEEGYRDPIFGYALSFRLLEHTYITAVFGMLRTLTVNALPPEGGWVEKIPDQTQYVDGQMVTLWAHVNPDYTFTGWDGLPAGEISGLSSGDGSLISFYVSQDHTVTANFSSGTVQLTYGDYTGGNITGDAEGPYPLNSTVNLQASPNTGYRFVRWLVNGADAGSDPNLALLMDENKTVAAVFVYQFTLTVVNGSGSGTYDEGAVVEIVAAYPQGNFDQWTGDVATVADVFSATTTITVNGDYTVTAQQQPPPLEVLVETEDDLDWVYQNTPNIMSNGGHSIWLRVTVVELGGNDSVAVTVSKQAGSGPGEVTVEDDPGADPLVKWIYGGLRTDGIAGSGNLTLEVTCTGNVSGQEVVLVPLTVRRLGDIDGNGAPEPGDVTVMIMKLNGTPPAGYHDKAFDLDANGAAEPGDVQILMNILNDLPVP